MQSVEDIDREVLTDFLIEGVWQRAKALGIGLTNFYAKKVSGRLLEVEFYRNYLMSLDDLVNWYHVLKEWQPNWKPIHEILRDVQARKRSGAATFAAYTLEEIARTGREALYERLNMPAGIRLSQLGWEDNDIAEYQGMIRVVLDRLYQGIKDRVLYGGVRADMAVAFRDSGIIEEYSTSDGSFHEVMLVETSSGLEVLGSAPTRSYLVKVDRRDPMELFEQIKVNASTLATLLLAFCDGQYGETPIIPPVFRPTQM